MDFPFEKTGHSAELDPRKDIASILIDSQPKSYAVLNTLVSRSWTMSNAVRSLTDDKTPPTKILLRTRSQAFTDLHNTKEAKQINHQPIHAIFSNHQGSKHEHFRNLRDLAREQLEISG